jgi:lysophospholipase L1-like esterase
MLYSVLLLVTLLFVTSILAEQIEKIRVTCIGDSITEGYGCVNSTYTVNLQNILGEKYYVTNAGASGQTMLKEGLCYNDNLDEICSYWDTDEYKIALSSQADIYTIMLGTNDAKYFNWQGVQENNGDFYVLDYVDMIANLKKLNPKPKVFVLIPPPIFDGYNVDTVYFMNSTIINNILPKVIRNLANVITDIDGVIDIQSAILSSNLPSDYLTCDGCHPKETANQIIAQTIAETILKL